MMSPSWLFLFIAIPFGALGTISMKLSNGFRKRKPTVALIIFYLISFSTLTFALRDIDMSIVYAIWSGLGTVLVAIIGILLFDESISLKKIICLTLIVVGVIGIHLTNAFH